MSTALKQFLEEVSKNEELKAKVMALQELEKNEAVQAVITLAKEAGYALTEEDFVAKKAEGELSDEEVEAVAGGERQFDDYTREQEESESKTEESFVCSLFGSSDDFCDCVFGGDGDDCVCFIYGFGD